MLFGQSVQCLHEEKGGNAVVRHGAQVNSEITGDLASPAAANARCARSFHAPQLREWREQGILPIWNEWISRQGRTGCMSIAAGSCRCRSDDKYMFGDAAPFANSRQLT